MGYLSQLKARFSRATAAPVTIPGLRFPVLFLANPAAFQHGLELQNDERTPIAFVVRALQTHAGLAAGDASVAAALCHSLGGVVIPLSSGEAAATAACDLAASAAAANSPLYCRAVGAPGDDNGGGAYTR